jgi:hypothetical protein
MGSKNYLPKDVQQWKVDASSKSGDWWNKIMKKWGKHQTTKPRCRTAIRPSSPQNSIQHHTRDKHLQTHPTKKRAAHCDVTHVSNSHTSHSPPKIWPHSLIWPHIQFDLLPIPKSLRQGVLQKVPPLLPPLLNFLPTSFLHNTKISHLSLRKQHKNSNLKHSYNTLYSSKRLIFESVRNLSVLKPPFSIPPNSHTVQTLSLFRLL